MLWAFNYKDYKGTGKYLEHHCIVEQAVGRAETLQQLLPALKRAGGESAWLAGMLSTSQAFNHKGAGDCSCCPASRHTFVCGRADKGTPVFTCCCMLLLLKGRLWPGNHPKHEHAHQLRQQSEWSRSWLKPTVPPAGCCRPPHRARCAQCHTRNQCAGPGVRHGAPVRADLPRLRPVQQQRGQVCPQGDSLCLQLGWSCPCDMHLSGR